MENDLRFSDIPYDDTHAKALRNASIMKWYHEQSEETQLNIRMLYAGHLNCPLCEITEYLMEPEDLDFIWSLFESQIRLFEARANN